MLTLMIYVDKGKLRVDLLEAAINIIKNDRKINNLLSVK